MQSAAAFNKFEISCLQDEYEWINDVDTAALEVGDLASRNRQMVKTSDRGNLPVEKAHREAEFLALAHQLTVDTGGRLIVGKYALIEGQGNESLESFSQP